MVLLIMTNALLVTHYTCTNAAFQRYQSFKTLKYDFLMADSDVFVLNPARADTVLISYFMLIITM